MSASKHRQRAKIYRGLAAQNLSPTVKNELVRSATMHVAIAEELDKRSWRKVRCYIAEEFVIVGFTGGTAISQLLLGYYTKDGRLHYAGRVGVGLTRGERTRLTALLQPLISRTTPIVRQPWTSRFDFGQPLDLDAVQWTRPKLVAHVRYLSWTADGHLRHAAYFGLREDMAAKDVVIRRDTTRD